MAFLGAGTTDSLRLIGLRRFSPPLACCHRERCSSTPVWAVAWGFGLAMLVVATTCLVLPHGFLDRCRIWSQYPRVLAQSVAEPRGRNRVVDWCLVLFLGRLCYALLICEIRGAHS
jgi:hypothetical protein